MSAGLEPTDRGDGGMRETRPRSRAENTDGREGFFELAGTCTRRSLQDL